MTYRCNRAVITFITLPPRTFLRSPVAADHSLEVKGGQFLWSVVAAIALVGGIASFGFLTSVMAGQITYLGINCPESSTLLPTNPSDEKELRSLLPKIILLQYPDPDYKEYGIHSLQQAANARVYGKMAANICGEEVAKSTWVVQLGFPQLEPSASLSQGQLFVAKTKQGWIAWFRYH